MHLKKDRLFLAIVFATTLLVTRVHGSDNSSNPESESNFTLQEALDWADYPRTKENITRLVDKAKKLVHEIYGCENGTVVCPASTRMSDLLFGVLIHNSEEESSTDDILQFMNAIMKVAAPNCPSRHKCTCLATSLYLHSENPWVSKSKTNDTEKKIKGSFRNIGAVLGCVETMCKLEGIMYDIYDQAVYLAHQLAAKDGWHAKWNVSPEAILSFLDEILYLIRPCSQSCERFWIDDRCESHDLETFAERWSEPNWLVGYGGIKEEEAQKSKKKKRGKQKRKKIRRRKKRRNSKNKKSKSGGSSDNS